MVTYVLFMVTPLQNFALACANTFPIDPRGLTVDNQMLNTKRFLFWLVEGCQVDDCVMIKYVYFGEKIQV